MTTRRDFLADVTRLAALCAVVPNDWRVTWRPRLADDPFTLGVASGDPTPDGVMLWTRLAPKPLEPFGGMTVRTAVRWEVAEDEAFAKIVKNGTATAGPELGFSLHVDVSGLAPDRWYFYRFTVGDAKSPIGRTRTAPAAGATTPLSLAVVSCQHYEQGLYTSYRHLAAEEIDLVAHLGDYIYENGPITGRPRLHASNEPLTLDDYRARYGQYKSDPLLMGAHARCPWVVTWDDHEIDNNYVGLVGENDLESEEQMRNRRAAGYQAWWEHQPVRVPRARAWSDLSITRTVDWGNLTRFWVLDTRQFRSDQPCNDGTRRIPCGEWGKATDTVLGTAQEQWLTRGLSGSDPRWHVLANQVMVAPYDNLAGEGTSLPMDHWSGYPVARDRLLGEIAKRAPNRTVVITGDIHASWVNELKSSFTPKRGETPKTIAAEFVGTSISSGGDGSDNSSLTRVAADNPHIKWQNNRRGYFKCTVTPDTWRTDYRTVPFVSRPDAPVSTASSWMVTRGRPGIEKA